jgi:RNA polymerase sigma factor (sigma-70 family)
MSKILVVDDDPMIVTAIQFLLEAHALPSESASDCDSAEARMASEFFPIVLADFRLGTEEEGLRLLDSVRRLSPRSRVASMTGYADAATEERLRERGAVLVLSKPVVPEELVTVLFEMLAAINGAPEQEDLDAVYQTTTRTLHHIARRYGFDREDAEELIQETWLLFLEKRAAVRSPRTWLSGTCANLCRQHIGRRVRDRQRDAQMPEISAAPQYDSVLSVHQALERMDERSRQLCTLIGLEERSYEEVSVATNLPIGSVGPLYIRAKKRLRRELAA